jgi:hypothetical protein
LSLQNRPRQEIEECPVVPLEGMPSFMLESPRGGSMKKRTLGDVAREISIPEAFRKSGETAKKTGAAKLSMREIVSEVKAARREKRAKYGRALKTGS